MKKQSVTALILFTLILIISLAYEYFDTDEIQLSRDSGFYEESFELRMKAPNGCTLYYTLDCTTPSPASAKYTSPITIFDNSDAPNVYSSIEDISAGCKKELIAKANAKDPGYVIPDYPVDKCITLRVAAFNKDNELVDEKTAAYFCDYSNKSGYANTGFISIIAEPSDLISDETGILVLGDTFKTYAANHDLSLKEWEKWGANYRKHGREYERRAYISFFDENKTPELSGTFGIRTKGGISRSYPFHSLKLYARKEYGQKFFYADFFDTNRYTDVLDLNSGGQTYLTKLRDVMAADLLRGRSFLVVNFKAYSLFINGEYFGLYFLSENQNETLISKTYDVKAKDVLIWKAGEMKAGDEDDLANYDELRNKFAASDMTDPVNYAELGNFIDIDSFIDYYAAEIFLAHKTDWPYANEAFWKTDFKADNNVYYDSRWRFMLYDVNSNAINLKALQDDTIKTACELNSFFAAIIKNKDFQRQFTIVMTDLINNNFNSERVNSYIDNYRELYTDSLNNNAKRFFADTKNEKLENEFDSIREFMNKRSEVVTAFLTEDFDLSGELAALHLNTNNPVNGLIKVNTSYVNIGTSGFDGKYFIDFPITISAEDSDEYKFVKWSGDIESTDKVLTIDLSQYKNGIKINAIYE